MEWRPSPHFVSLDWTRTTVGPSDPIEVYYDYDDYGNLAQVYEPGDPGTTADDRYRVMAYTVNTAAWIVNRPKTEEVKRAGLALVARTEYYYDHHSTLDQAPEKGDLTRLVQVDLVDSNHLVTWYDHDAYGNVTDVTDGKGYTTTTTYDTTYHTFPETVTYPVEGLSTTSGYDAGFGLVEQFTDLNGQTTHYEYDTHGRLWKVWAPLDYGSGTPTVEYVYTPTASGLEVQTRCKEAYGSASTYDSVAFYNGLGQLVQTRADGEGGFIYVDYQYDGLGRQWKVSAPYTGSAQLWSETAYDALGRTAVITHTDSTSRQYIYTGRERVEVRDENGHYKGYSLDALGRTVQVDEYRDGCPSTPYATTHYSYDLLGNLTGVEDDLGHTTVITYDSLGRKLAMTDPDMGDWSYTYDADSNLETQTDASGTVVTFAYDALDRLTGKSYSDPNTTPVTYTYDLGTNGQGRRTGLADASGMAAYTYDQQGRLSTETKTVDGAAYTTGFTYDPLDRVRTLTYPDGEVITYDYNQQGLLESMDGLDAYVGNVDYNALGQTTLVQLGNGLATTYGYHEANFRLESVVTTGGLQNLSYTYDDVGNVQTMGDSVGGLNLSYTYDELDRLTGVSGSYGRTYSYNPIGNLTDKNGLTLTYEDPDHPHAVSGTSEDWALDYSPTGNLITRTVGSQVVTFGCDAENRLTEVISDATGSAITTTLVYDGDGRRVKKVDESGTTVYVGEHYEVHYPEAYSSTIERVSVASNGAEGNDVSYLPSISADGRFVAFESNASNLVLSDTNGSTRDIFVRDRQTEETTLVSVDSNGTQGDGTSYGPSISADGRFVAFDSYASNLIISDTNGSTLDVFVHDRQTEETTLVSVDSNGTQGNGTSYEASISAGGRFVAFESGASNLVISDTNGSTHDIFVRDRQTEQTTLVSVDSNGTQGNGGSYEPSISADGRFVAFDSLATNLVLSDTNGSTCDIFVHDRQTEETTLVSVDSNSTQGDGGSWEPSISADGHFVAFESSASNLVISDTNGSTRDVFVHDRQTGVTTLVSVDSNGTQGNDVSSKPSISADGRFVAFGSLAHNLVDGDDNEKYDIFVHDRQTGETAWVSVTSDSIGDGSRFPSISADGRFVAFHSHATNLVDGDNNGYCDVFASNPFLGSATKHYYANGQRIATRVDGTLYYVHQDHLGSTVAVSDAAGQAMGRVQYDPYGEVLTSTLPITLTDRLFTGARFDGTIGLYQMGARWYDPALGRWIQADTIVPEPGNPQALNRYTYVYNNPLRYTDPSGHRPPTPQDWPFAPREPLPPWPSYEERFDAQSNVADNLPYSIFPPLKRTGMMGWAIGRLIAGPDRSVAAYDISCIIRDNILFGGVALTGGIVDPTGPGLSDLASEASPANAPPGGTPRDYPLGFEDCRQFHCLAKQLKRAAGVQDAVVGVTGSSTTDVSYKTGEPFGPASDIDFFIVSDEFAAQVPRRFVRPNELIDMGATLYFDELRRFEELATQELGRKVTVRIYSSAGYQLRAKPMDIIVP